MTKYRKKPVVVEAFRVGRDARPDWFEAKLQRSAGFWYYEIETLEGTMKANEGDYIIKGVNGEIYPCKPDIFEKTYEEVAEKQARIEAYSYVDHKTGEIRADVNHSGDVDILLGMSVALLQDIINDACENESAYNLLLASAVKALFSQDYDEQEELEND